MIYSLTGKIVEFSANEIIIDVNGVGYQVAVPSPVVGGLKCGETASIFTYLNVKEDALELYGFNDKKMQECFKMLISVSGVGPKVGIGILSHLTPDGIILAISAQDHTAFKKCPGIGPKLAQRIVLELKDKAAKQSFTMVDATAITGVQATDTGSQQQAVQALVALGYSQTQAAQAVAEQQGDLPVSELVRLSLKQIGLKK